MGAIESVPQYHNALYLMFHNRVINVGWKSGLHEVAVLVTHRSEHEPIIYMLPESGHEKITALLLELCGDEEVSLVDTITEKKVHFHHRRLKTDLAACIRDKLLFVIGTCVLPSSNLMIKKQIIDDAAARLKQPISTADTHPSTLRINFL